MATSYLANLFSLLNPSKPPPSAPPSRAPKLPPLHLSSHPGCEPLVLSNEAQSYSSDVAAVVCPSLAYANTMFFRSAYNVQVIVDDNEPEEKLLGRFRREVMRVGLIQECKRRRYFENKQEEKKRKAREAAKRNRRRSLSHFHSYDRCSALCYLLCFYFSCVAGIRECLMRID